MLVDCVPPAPFWGKGCLDGSPLFPSKTVSRDASYEAGTRGRESESLSGRLDLGRVLSADGRYKKAGTGEITSNFVLTQINGLW